MPIPMMIPAEFLQPVLDGRYLRYGCIIKDVASGQIVGHLKELSGLSRVLSNIPIRPLLGSAAVIAEGGRFLDTQHQLRQIRQILEQLQMVSSIGAVASVAGLGVSVAGFAVVLKRLDRLEHGLNQGMDRIRVAIEKLHLKMDMLQLAELRAAWELLAGARRTDRPEHALGALKDADRCFQKYRCYYHALIMELRPASRPELSLPHVRELYGRFFTCAVAELEANFLLHDFAQWHFRHEAISRQLAETCSLDAREMLRARVDALGLVTDAERLELKDQVQVTHEVCRETQDRILTASQEVMWVDKHSLTPEEYLRELLVAPDEGIILCPHKA
jgi:hypothetical protein